jgi:hypothetical protein
VGHRATASGVAAAAHGQVTPEMEDAVLRDDRAPRRHAVPDSPGSPPAGGAAGRARRWKSDASLETAYCAEIVADTYQAMGLLPADRTPSWYDPGRFWSGDELALEQGAPWARRSRCWCRPAPGLTLRLPGLPGVDPRVPPGSRRDRPKIVFSRTTHRGRLEHRDPPRGRPGRDPPRERRGRRRPVLRALGRAARTTWSTSGAATSPRPARPGQPHVRRRRRPDDLRLVGEPDVRQRRPAACANERTNA